MLKTPDIPRENLLELARSQFQLAQQHCDDCCTYHAIWPYLRMAGAVGGVEADEPFLQPILADLFRQDRTRILLAGSADSGVTAMVHRACVKFHHMAQLTVVDRCMTPLVACQTYGHMQGLDVSVLHADLRKTDLPSKFDLIIGHSVLPLIPPDDRRALLAALAQKLTANGRMLLTVRISSERESSDNFDAPKNSPYDKASMVVDQLAAQSMALPLSSSSFHALVYDYFKNRKLQVTRFTAKETLIADFESVGLRAEALMPLGYGNSYDVRSQGWAYVVCPM